MVLIFAASTVFFKRNDGIEIEVEVLLMPLLRTRNIFSRILDFPLASLCGLDWPFLRFLGLDRLDRWLILKTLTYERAGEDVFLRLWCLFVLWSQFIEQVRSEFLRLLRVIDGLLEQLDDLTAGVILCNSHIIDPAKRVSQKGRYLLSD